jgi:hypothetical protein
MAYKDSNNIRSFRRVQLSQIIFLMIANNFMFETFISERVNGAFNSFSKKNLKDPNLKKLLKEVKKDSNLT